MSSIPNNSHYYYESERIFKSEVDLIHAFVMENYEIGMHMQDFFEINIITRGEGKHYIEDKCICALCGDVFIIPPNVRHGYTGGVGFDAFHVLINDKFIKKHIADLQMLPSFFTLFSAEPLMRTKAIEPLHLHLSHSGFEQVKGLLDLSLGYGDQSSISDSLTRSGLALALITLLCKLYSESEVDGDDLQGDRSFMNAISVIHQRYYEKLTIAELSRISMLSRSAFIRKFKDVCKMPPSEYITKCRVSSAEYMLANTDLAVSDIAVKCGFYDSSHFSRIFEAAKGVSPSEYRKSLR